MEYLIKVGNKICNHSTLPKLMAEILVPSAANLATALDPHVHCVYLCARVQELKLERVYCV